MPKFNSNLISARNRSSQPNSLYNRTQSRVGGWETTPSGLKTKGIEISSADSNIKVSSSATKFSTLSSDSLTFTRDGGGTTFNYAKQMQFIPASLINLGTAFDFTDNGFLDYDDDQFDVVFTIRNLQTYDASEGGDQNLQLSAENKSATGFTPTANLFIGSVLSTTDVTSSFSEDEASQRSSALGSSPVYSIDKDANDALHDLGISNVVGISVTFTITFSSIVNKSGEGLLDSSGYLRVGNKDSDAFQNNAAYLVRDWSTSRASNGTNTITKSFSYSSPTSGTGDHLIRINLILNDTSSDDGTTGSIAGALTSITYTTSSGTTTSITGADKVDALVIAR